MHVELGRKWQCDPVSSSFAFVAPTPTMPLQFSTTHPPLPLPSSYYQFYSSIVLHLSTVLQSYISLQFYSSLQFSTVLPAPASTTSSTVLQSYISLQFNSSIVLYNTATYSFRSQWKGTSYHSLGSFALHSSRSLRSKINDLYPYYFYYNSIDSILCYSILSICSLFYVQYLYILHLQSSTSTYFTCSPPYSYHLPTTPRLQLLPAPVPVTTTSTSSSTDIYWPFVSYHRRQKKKRKKFSDRTHTVSKDQLCYPVNSPIIFPACTS